jgi:ribosomal protein S21
MVEIKRKKGETFDAFLRRFQRRFQESGKNPEVKKRRFLQRHQNQNKRRASALRREEMRTHYAYMAKTGQLKEETKTRGPRKSV